jgi:hypothetical protein
MKLAPKSSSLPTLQQKTHAQKIKVSIKMFPKNPEIKLWTDLGFSIDGGTRLAG